MSPSSQWPVRREQKRERRRALLRSARTRRSTLAARAGSPAGAHLIDLGDGHQCISAQPAGSVQCTASRGRAGDTDACPPARSRQASRPSPEDELVQVELDDAHRKRRTGRATDHRGRSPRCSSSAASSRSRCRGSRTTARSGTSSRRSRWQWLVVLALATVLNLATYAPPLVAALPGPPVSARGARHVGLDGALDGRSGRRSRRDGDVVRDAARLGLQRPARRPCRRRHRSLEPVRDPRLPDHRRRRRRRRGRTEPHARARRGHRARRLRGDRRRLRRRTVQRSASRGGSATGPPAS